MTALMCFALSCVLLQTAPIPDEVLGLIKQITPTPVGNVRRGMTYRVTEARILEKRMVAIQRLGALGQDASAAVPVLSQLIVDRYEPRLYKIAEIETLKKIGPAAVQSVDALRHVQGSKDLLLSITAECAVLHIQSRPEDQPLRDKLEVLLALLEVLSVSHDGQLLALVNAYIRQPAEDSRNNTFAQIEVSVINSKRPELLLQELLQNSAGRELGQRLLNSSRIDGESLTANMLLSGAAPYPAGVLFENLNAREVVAMKVLESASAHPGVWEDVFEKYRSIVDGQSDVSRQGSLLERLRWLQGISVWPDRCSELVLEWLIQLWSQPGASESVQSEIVVTARTIIDTLGDDEATAFIQMCTQGNLGRLSSDWASNTDTQLQFVIQLIPDSRASNIDRQRINQVLAELRTSSSFDSLAAADLLLGLIRQQPTQHPVADWTPPLAEQFLLDGRFADGEAALLLALDANPTDDELRFGLGAIQFVRAVETLGKGLYQYGAVSANSRAPFLRLPVPHNPAPAAISYQAFGRILDVLAADLGRAEATLALISDDEVKLRLRLAKITFDFSGTGENQTTLLDILTKLNGGRFLFEIANPEFRIHFDRGDVAWLRAYCHLLCAMIDGYRAVDLEAHFAQRVASVFPEIEDADDATNPPEATWLKLNMADSTRLRRMRLHLLAVCELNPETWRYIRNESDDDFEWLSHPKQTDQLSLPLTDERIDRWLEAMEQLQGLLKGESLISPVMLGIAMQTFADKGLALNLREVLDDPPQDLFNYERLITRGLDERYFELAKNKREFDTSAFLSLLQLFQGPFSFAYAARLN